MHDISLFCISDPKWMSCAFVGSLPLYPSLPLFLFFSMCVACPVLGAHSTSLESSLLTVEICSSNFGKQLKG